MNLECSLLQVLCQTEGFRLHDGLGPGDRHPLDLTVRLHSSPPFGLLRQPDQPVGNGRHSKYVTVRSQDAKNSLCPLGEARRHVDELSKMAGGSRVDHACMILIAPHKLHDGHPSHDFINPRRRQIQHRLGHGPIEWKIDVASSHVVERGPHFIPISLAELRKPRGGVDLQHIESRGDAYGG